MELGAGKTYSTMKLPVSDTGIKSSPERCCAAMKEQPRRMTQPAHHWTDCSWVEVVVLIYPYWLVLRCLWLALHEKAFSLSDRPA